MSRPIFLTREELQGVTGRAQNAAQIRALCEMGIDFKIRPDGSPLVSRLAYERALGGIDIKSARTDAPDLSSLDVA